MTAFARRAAALVGLEEARLERLSGGDLSEVLLFRRPDGRCTVAKSGSKTSTEATMLRALAGMGVPAPVVEGEHDGILLLAHVENDRLFSPKAWASIGEMLQRLHAVTAESYGWPTDYAIGSVGLDNRENTDWPKFWTEQRLIATASVLDRPWRERVEQVAERLAAMLPKAPRPALLHGDLWSGNVLVRDGALAALIDPACYHGHCEVDLAMLTLFDTPGESFWDSYGALEEGWEERRPAYQLFPVLVHLRLFGATYAGLADRLLDQLGV